jgi:hypothetical protein
MRPETMPAMPDEARERQRRRRAPSRLIILALAGCAGLWPGPARAQDSHPAAKPWYETIGVHGFLAASWEYNFNQPDSQLNRLRVFDLYDRTFELDVAELAVERPAVDANDVGFRVDFAVGSTVPRVSAARGLFRDPATGEAEDIDLQQAYLSYVAPVGRGLRLDVGKWVTHIGYELIPGYDGYNENATRSFLFGYVGPFTHTGVRASYSFNDHLSGQLMLVNGWDNALDNNRAKSVGLQVAYSPAQALSVSFNLISGAEMSNDDSDRRTVADVVATWKPASRLGLGLNLDLGREEGTFGAGSESRWSGAAGYVQYEWTPRFSTALRAEVFDDRDGARTGTAQRLKEVTFTPSLRFGLHALVRADLRYDWSDRQVFEKGAALVRRQPTAAIEVLCFF